MSRSPFNLLTVEWDRIALEEVGHYYKVAVGGEVVSEALSEVSDWLG